MKTDCMEHTWIQLSKPKPASELLDFLAALDVSYLRITEQAESFQNY